MVYQWEWDLIEYKVCSIAIYMHQLGFMKMCEPANLNNRVFLTLPLTRDGLTHQQEPANYRTEFVQNVRTYKRLNRLSQREEYYPDPFFRVLSLLATFAIVSVRSHPHACHIC
jgi:hypothetical protein